MIAIQNLSLMKKIYSIIPLCLFSLALSAQVPNGGFENWGSPDPVDWQTSNNNSASVINVTASTTAHSGSKGMRMETWTVQNLWFGAIAVCPQVGNFFPITGTPTALTGYAITNFVGDRFDINYVVRKDTTDIGGGTISLTANSAVYQQFTIPTIYQQPGPPDSAAIAMAEYTAGGGAVGLNPGTYVILDDLQFVTANGIKEQLSDQTAIESVQPNPAAGSAQVQYTVADQGQVRISLVDLSGREVSVLFEGNQQPGRYRVYAALDGMSDGLYLVRLQTGAQISTQRFCITH